MPGNKRPPGKQVTVGPQAALLFAAEGKEQVLILDKRGADGRNYILDEKGDYVVTVATAGKLEGAKMRAWHVHRPNGGQTTTAYDLLPSEYEKFPFAKKHASRTKTGLAEHKDTRAKEEYGEELECIRCGKLTGQQKLGPDGKTVLYRTGTVHYKLDHKRRTQPSWHGTRVDGVLAEQLRKGAAVPLCLQCEADSTHDAPPGAGTTHVYKKK